MILGKNYPVFPDCSTRYHALYHGGTRQPIDIRDIVIHTTEGETAEGAARWFATPNLPPNEQGSSNVIVSDDICYRVLDDLVIPWAAPPFNMQGFHIEIVGFAHWTKAEWATHKKRVENAAYRAAIRCNRFSVPIRWNSVADLLANKHGITSHANISAAFHQTTHTDPGEGFPVLEFMELVQWYSNRLHEQST